MLISLIIILIIFSSCSLIFEQVKTPIFNPEEGTFSDYMSVEIYSATAIATITYTTDGSTPTQNHGTIYTKPITIYKTTTIKAIAYKNLMNDSSVATATFTINKVAPVTFSPIGGYFNYPQLVTISCETEGVTIKYTTDNTIPSPTNGNTYNSPLEITSNITLKAIAYKDGMTSSDIVIANYNISNPSGTLDTFFGVNGISINSIGNSDDNSRSVAIQSDGKIVVAGYSNNGNNNDFAVVRYNSDGSLDTSFGSNGKVTTSIGSSNDASYSVAIQSDGKIVVAGYSNNGNNNDFAVVRYNSDGSLDTSFGSNGKVTTSIGSSDDVGCSFAIQSDGKIVVAGYSNNGSDNDFAVVRYIN